MATKRHEVGKKISPQSPQRSQRTDHGGRRGKGRKRKVPSREGCAKRGVGSIREWTLMNANEGRFLVSQFACIRVHSWTFLIEVGVGVGIGIGIEFNLSRRHGGHGGRRTED